MKQAKQKERERNHLNAFKKGKFLRKNETSNPYKSHYLGYEETRLVRRKSALHCRGTRIPDAATFATPSKYIYIYTKRERRLPPRFPDNPRHLLLLLAKLCWTLSTSMHFGRVPTLLRPTFRFPPKSFPLFLLSPYSLPSSSIHPCIHPSIHLSSRR